MSAKTDRALELFNHDFSCAQVVLAAFCEDYDLDLETALKVAGGLGGGCRSGDVCGAALGGAIVIGLKYGQCIPDDIGTKTNCNAKTEQFINEFRTTNKALTCRDILGFDISTEEGREQYFAMDRSTSPCADVVKNAVEILERLGY